MAVRVVTDSTSYLPDDELVRLKIRRVSLHVHDGDQMRAETDIDLDAFYARLADTRSIPTSSQPSPEEMAETFSAIHQAGDEALGVFMSSKMSGTVQSAELAASLVRSEHDSATIGVLDSESNCMQEGFAVLSAAEAAAAGRSLPECVEQAMHTMRRSRFLFVPQSLEYLARGGRISGASALLGSLLQIMPILTVEDGETTVAAKVRTRAKALAEMAGRMREDVERCGFKRAVVHGIVDLEEARRFRDRYLGEVYGDVPVVPVGPVIGLHVGPAVGVVYETVEPLR